MTAINWRLAALMLLLGLSVGGRVAWLWQANSNEKAMADQASDYQREREAAANAAIEWQAVEQSRRRALEDRLRTDDETHYKELRDAQQTQDRLRDRLATADLRLSVLLDISAEGSGCGVPTAAGGPGVVHGGARAQLNPAHAQRIINITDAGDQGLIALTACQAYVKAVSVTQ
jgi:hypothetical protein